MFSIILWSSLTRQHKKDALVDSAARGCLIALWNTVSLIRVFLQIQNEGMNPEVSQYAFGGSTWPPK